MTTKQAPLVSFRLSLWIVTLIALWKPLPVSSSKWVIEEPNITYDELTDIFTMHYDLDPSIDYAENLRTAVLIQNCTYPELGVADGVVSNFVNETGYHIFEVDPYTMSKDPRIFNYGEWADSTAGNPQKKANIKLCVRASLWTGPESNPAAVEAGSFETVVTLEIDLNDDPRLNAANLDYTDKGTGKDIENENYEVYAYFCDPETHELVDVSPVNQGEAVSVCVESSEDALSRGVYIDSIERFSWLREYPFANVSQDVIRDGALVRPEISAYDCVPQSIICDFSMILLGDFFFNTGEAIGMGVAKLTFGEAIPGNSARVRFLHDGRPDAKQLQSSQEPRRKLQEQGNGGFGINLGVNPADDSRPPLATAGGEGTVRIWKQFSILVSHLLVLWVGLDCF